MLAAHLPTPPACTLDLGCGNGRLGAYLAERFGPDRTWVGLDASPELLARARARRDLPRRSRLLRAELGAPGLPVAAGAFDLVALVAVLHHVPGEAARAALLQRGAACVAPGGALAASFWRFGAAARIARRRLPFEDVGIDPADVEPGDALLPFAGDASVPRYGHAFDRAEVERLARAPGLPLRARFDADGREGDLDAWLVWERPQ